jgi:hypothetical protein
MPKSNSSDGRRGNRPPEKHKIKPGEVRNPDGRRGKSGGDILSRVDEYILKEALRIVSTDESGDVNAAKRLVQEEFAAALLEKDPKARGRLITKLSHLQAKADRNLREFTEWYLTCKVQYEELFHTARKSRTVPPDVGHPDHVDLINGNLVFTGPADRRSREEWEHLKAAIKIAACLHERCRQNFKLSATEKNRTELKVAESHRRRLMRRVPKGWNWREDIYCRYSQAAFVKETISKIEEHF